jgi:hypothetical protein
MGPLGQFKTLKFSLKIFSQMTMNSSTYTPLYSAVDTAKPNLKVL